MTTKKQEGRMRVISSQQLIGMCAVSQGRVLGKIESVVLNESASRLHGVVIRRGIGAAKWFAREHIRLLGQSCVLVEGKGGKPPKALPAQPGYVRDMAGLALGTVTDAVLAKESLRVMALEISFGTLYRLAGQRAYASRYRVIKRPDGCEVVAQSLDALAQVTGERGTKQQ